ncbi:MAG: sugar ABC transporter ATP-binding protein, partial [Actinomycetota bacterium]
MVALDEVDFDLQEGEIHAIVGHNGAGKSTLVKIIAGDLRPDAGVFRVAGEDVAFSSPGDAIASGIRIVTQERALVPLLTVEENVFLGQWPVGRAGLVDWSATRREADRVLGDLGVSVDPAAQVRSLRPAEQTLVEIAKGLSHEMRVLLLDEPTSTISEEETSRLFVILRRLRSMGVGIILISHRVPDIMAVADRMTVLRDGRVVYRTDLEGLSARDIVRQMAGDVDEPSRDHRPTVPGPAVLQARGVTVDGVLEDVSFDLRAGEIAGVFGLVGSGATELPAALCGAIARRGDVRVNGKALGGPTDAVDLGVGFVPPDRAMGILDMLPLQRNLGISSLSRFSRLGMFRRALERTAALQWIEQLSITPADPTRVMSTFSGGNQQKSLLGRWLMRSAKVLLLAEPTRGVDVAARAAIHRTLLELREAGVAILFASSDLDEVVTVSDRVLVFTRGRMI